MEVFELWTGFDRFTRSSLDALSTASTISPGKAPTPSASASPGNRIIIVIICCCFVVVIIAAIIVLASSR
jgi:hypothetical protein